MTQRQIIDVRTLNINDDISVVGSILLRKHETMYVVDSKNSLLGVVTIGDFLRKAHVSKNVSEVMNRNFFKIEQTLNENDKKEISKDTAIKLFSLIPNINEIPVVEGSKLLYVLKRDKPYHIIDGKVIRFNKIGLSFAEADKGKKLIVIGKNEISKLILDCVNNPHQVHFMDDIIDLAYEDASSYFVMVIEPNRTFAQIQRDFASLNLIEGINYNLVCYRNFFETFKILTDAHLMYSRILDLPGFAVYGNPREAKLRIVTLGASTTDPCFNDFASWSEHLYNIMKDKGVESVIYNGGHCAYNSSLELIKLIRDIIPLEPDIVISYGGIADFKFVISDETTALCKRPFLHYFHAEFFERTGADEVIFGLRNDKPIDRFWIDNMRMMNSMCSEFGIKHLGVLQANPYSEGLPPEHLNAIWRILVSQSFSHVPWGDEVVGNACDANYFKQIYDKVESQIESIPYIHSFRHIFDGIDDIYYDGAHVHERGNEVIAAHMYETLKAMDYV